ncbi:acyl-CoA thioesterase domain-containing protein [Sphingobium sp. Sx8-8]|uniref:acyl-CoA thioesterase n=1 Tax=Sphingobium sp. Sx8-8 TaxID=2933617 RepID=UPI001F599C68|nr:acyl-CoA thioesterase domain-containing protein [Sphingobium sp. Sx8-8]
MLDRCGSDANGQSQPLLVRLLTLREEGGDRFTATMPDGPARPIFGGQLLGQSVMAALQTVGDDRPAHSMHAHFLRAGLTSRPLTYAVERIRDGRGFSTRSVEAIQDGRVLLQATISCHAAPEGLSFQAPMPQVPGPEGLRTEQELRDRAMERDDIQWVSPPTMGGMGMELRSTCPRDFAEPRVMQPAHQFWIRPTEPVGQDWRLRQAVLAYTSDMMLLSTTLLPHGIYWSTTGMQRASLDHSIWFHGVPSFDDWTLWSLHTSWSGNGRGLAHGQFYDRSATLIASVAQEGLIRVVEERKPMADPDAGENGAD